MNTKMKPRMNTKMKPKMNTRDITKAVATGTVKGIKEVAKGITTGITKATTTARLGYTYRQYLTVVFWFLLLSAVAIGPGFLGSLFIWRAIKDIFLNIF